MATSVPSVDIRRRDALGDNHPEWSGSDRGMHRWVILLYLLAALLLGAWAVQSVHASTSPVIASKNMGAPFTHTKFCLHYPTECEIRNGSEIWLHRSDTEKIRQLAEVNTDVNRAITPEQNTGGLATEKWIVWPKSGDCNDYAVTKRHELLARGWPSGTLLLAEVVVASGEHHLVLVATTAKGDFVLDNLRGNITRWQSLPYQWVRIQSPRNPLYWQGVASPR